MGAQKMQAEDPQRLFAEDAARLPGALSWIAAVGSNFIIMSLNFQSDFC